MPEHYILPRWRADALEFDGVIIAEVSSEDDGGDRWQEIRIYRTTTQKYVTEVVGKSRRDGEHDIIHTAFWTKPEAVRKGLMRKDDDGRKYLTDLALEALEIAGETVPAIGQHVERTEII